jgi:hypothetical protein
MMRTYGRVYALNRDGTKVKPQPAGFPYWTEITTDANGFNDPVFLTTLCQVLLLNLGESPFYADYGIPDQQTIVQQVQPDFYVTRTQSQFAKYFAALLLQKTGSNPPSYRLYVTTNQGARVVLQVPQ